MPRLTTKGQVTVPKAVRDCLGALPGDELDFAIEDDRIVVTKRGKRGSFQEFLGYWKHLAGRSTDELIDEMRGPVELRD